MQVAELVCETNLPCECRQDWLAAGQSSHHARHLRDSFLHGSRLAHTIAGSEEGGYTLTRDFVVAMIEHFKAQKLIHKRFAFQILTQARISCSAPVSCYISCNKAMLHLMPSCTDSSVGLFPGIKHIGADLSGSARQTCPYPNLKALDTNCVRIAQHCHECRLEMHWQSCQRWLMSAFQTTSISLCVETHTGSSMTSAISLS